jgi:hypothetical protein
MTKLLPIPWGQFTAACDREDAAQSNRCKGCGDVLQEIVTGRRMLDGKLVCSDCYFDALSDSLEETPIHTPRVHRG